MAPAESGIRPVPRRLLAVNAGSSSIRFALFEAGAGLRKIRDGKLERIGLPGTNLAARAPDGTTTRRDLDAADHRSAAAALIDWLTAESLIAGLGAIGHRVVHGMRRVEPALVTPALLAELRAITPYDPEHLPREIALIEDFAARIAAPQVACFDTAFHAALPTCAARLPIPRRYGDAGVRRYGFHGLSYAYLCEELRRLGEPAAARGRLILAHLGNGASMAAVRDGRSIDTTMGFTPAGGLVMSTRSGDLDPGLACYFARAEGRDAASFQTMVNHESGLLGISETSSDVRDLLAREADDPRAAEALEVFCYQARKWIGALAAALGGVDALVFAGGIGENAAPIRARICAELGFLGITLDEARNVRNEPVISPAGAATAVRVVPTDEERMIARHTLAVLTAAA